MKIDIRSKVKKGITYVIPFICGILLMLLIFKVRGYEEVKAYVEVSPNIAIVNQDVVDDEEYDFSFGDKIVSMFLDSSKYSFVLTNYQDAEEGVKGYAYSGYILIDSNFTNSMYSINEEIPTKGKISYKINSNLDDDEKKSVEDYILSQLYIVDNNINYLYITSILEVLHGSQDNVEDVLSNEGAVDSILTNINDSNSKYYDSSKKFLEEAKKGEGSNNIEENGVEIDSNSLIDIQFDNSSLIALNNEISSEYENELKSNANNLVSIYSQYGKMMMEGNFNIQELGVDDVFLNFLNDGVDKLAKIDKLINFSHVVYEGVNSLDLAQYVSYIEFIDELYEDTIPNEDGKGDIGHFSTSMGMLRDEYQQVIVDFIKNYHYWATNLDQTCPNINNLPDITSPDYKTRYNCMADFKSKYGDKDIVVDYILLKNIYLKLIQIINSDMYNDIIVEYDSYVEYLDDSSYTDYVATIPFATLIDGYTKTENMCRNTGENNNIVIGFSCDLEGVLTWLLSDSINVAQTNKEELLNELVLQDVEISKLMSIRENELISNYLNTYPKLESVVTGGVNNVISEEGINSLESNMNGIQQVNKDLQDTMINNKISTQETINEITKEFKNKYPELTSGLDENSDLLYDFATLFENSNNAESANYFLYDFVSNPITVNKESDSEKLIPIEHGVDKEKIAILGAVTLSMAISSGIYYDLRRKYKHKGSIGDENVY